MFTSVRARRLMAALSVPAYVAVFVAFLFFERPGLGIGHLYYIAIALLALATGPLVGAGAGLLAVALFVAGLHLSPDVPPTEAQTASASIRFFTFVLVGVGFGWFASGNRALFAQLEHIAARDYLTGLKNTRSFEAALAGRCAAGDPFVLLLGDVDELKEINDVRGHVAGDAALVSVARGLERATRPDDHAARVGGDEFAVLVSGGAEASPEELADRLETAVAQAGVSITFGYACYPGEGREALPLYRAADRRLYERKPSGRARSVVLRRALDVAS